MTPGRHLAVNEPKRPAHTVIAEQPLAAADHDRVDHAELVDQVMLDQRLHQLATARPIAAAATSV